MKQFFQFISKIIVFLLLIALALDFGYSYVFSKSKERNKIENIINSKAKEYDVVILGSSRANNHFETQLFIDEGLKAYNYGMSGSRLQESALCLKLMLERKYRIKNIIIEIDLNINSEGYSKGTRARFMPYFKSSEMISSYYKQILPQSEYNSFYYLPFYRYINYNAQIGFREMFFSAIQRRSVLLDNHGFYPLYGKEKNLKYSMKKYFPKKNIDYELIKALCKENNINLIAVTTPICKGSDNFDYFKNIKKIYPEVHNYESYVSGDQFFSTCGHMNAEGAKLFTQKIIDDFFTK